MQDAASALCPRCGIPLPASSAGCPACLLGAGRSPEAAADELFQLVCRLPMEDREPLLAEADRDTPDLAQSVRRRLSAMRHPSGPTPAGVDPEGGPDAPWGIHASEEAPGSCIGAFRLVRCLGEGGMGTVWEAEQQAPVRRTVALKLIKLGMHTREVVKRFERERQTLALLNHPHIARVFEAGVTPSGRPYFAMERVSGSPITEACVAEGLPLKRRLELFLEICAAVEHAHQKGVIHRDLKPSNILVGGGRVTVIDFGIAKATQGAGDSLVTRRAQILGTPAYMSPEQAQSAGADLDTRTDVYALGGILYELLAGVPPFNATRLAQTSLADLQRILLEEDPPSPSTRLAAARRAGGGICPASR
ncbi:MAG: serine/threonine protein kinase [Verrucomicrobia bacterium]|nr:serine/threonine protein kinase [Verrucomicrobiota bacterium]